MASLPAQGGGKGNGNGNGHGQPPALDGEIAKLRDAPDLAVATDRARRVRSRPGGEQALIKLIVDRGLPAHVLGGVLTVFVEDNHRSPELMETLFRELSRADSLDRRQVFVKAIRRYDAKGDVLGPLLERLVSAENGGQRANVVEAIEPLVDTPQERRRVIGLLVDALQKEEDQKDVSALILALERLSLQQGLKTPAAWKTWFTEFSKEHPEGFEILDLSRDAVRRAREEARIRSEAERLRRVLIASEKASINELAAHGDIPSRFVDPKRSLPEVRLFAVARLADAFSRADGERKKRAVGDLLRVLDSDPDRNIRSRALEALAKVAGAAAGDEAVARPILKGLLPYVDPAGDQDLLSPAVKALGALRHPDAVPALEKVYRAFAGKEKEPFVALRRAAVEALTRLRSKDGGLLAETLILDALEDASAEVRIAALRGLGASKKPAYAEAVARELQKIKGKDTRLVYLVTLRNIGHYASPAVVAALMLNAGVDGEIQRQALLGLLDALARHGSALPSAAEVEKLLKGVFPGGVKQESTLEALVKEMVALKSPNLVDIAAAWCLQAKKVGRRKPICRILAETAQGRVELLVETAEKLITAGRMDEAEHLLRDAERRLLASPGGARGKSLLRRARLLLARALRGMAGLKPLQDAAAILSAAIKEDAADPLLYYERGLVYQAQGDKQRELALRDLAKALELTAEKDPERVRPRAAEAMARLHLGGGKPAEALKTLMLLPRSTWNGNLHYLAARAHFQRKNYEAAFREAGQAREKKAAVPETDLILLLLKSGMQARQGKAREEAAGLLEHARGKLAQDDFQRFMAVAARDAKLKELVARVDAAAEADMEALKKDARARGREVGTWLVHGLAALAEGGAAGERPFRNRLAVLSEIFQEAAKAGVFALPAEKVTPEALKAAAKKVSEWWRSRKKS